MSFYDFFSGQDPTIFGWRWMKQATDHILIRVSQSISSPLESVVEIGPGWGALAKGCEDRGLHYTAIDSNTRLLRRLGKIQTVCSFVPPIPLRDEICDAVVASHVIEHSNGITKAAELISEMKRIVRVDGCIIIVSPDLLWAGKYFWDCDYTHSFPTSSRRLYQMFVDQGLEVFHLEYVYNHLRGWRGYLVGRVVDLIPYRWAGFQPNSLAYSERIYKLRMTFSRAVLIMAKRPR